MDIVKFKREQEFHRQHVDRVHTMRHTINTEIPSSLGLKHLASRPKKQQLIDDRQQSIAKENRKLMERMTKVLSRDNKSITKSGKKAPSLNEKKWKAAARKLNRENQEMLDRIENVPPVLDAVKFEKDFARHVHIGAHLRRRQMVPMKLPPLGQEDFLIGGEAGSQMFDSQLYTSQQSAHSQLQNNMYEQSIGSAPTADGNKGANPIASMADFRKQVISKKLKASGPEQTQSARGARTTGSSGPDRSVEFSHVPQ